MCPLCIATGTIAFASAGSAGGLGAIAAKVLLVRCRRAAQENEALGELPIRAVGMTPVRAAGELPVTAPRVVADQSAGQVTNRQ